MGVSPARRWLCADRGPGLQHLPGRFAGEIRLASPSGNRTVWQMVLPTTIGCLNYLQQFLNWNRRPVLILGPASATQIPLLGRDGKRSAVDSTIELDPNLALGTAG